MEQRINIKPDPSFERIRKTFLLDGKPDRIPLCDFGIAESHTDGSLWKIFDDFDKMGVNAIHPLEPNSMDVEEVKRKWGHRFCLIGNIELDLLSRGTPDQIDALVKDRIEKLGYNGGYCVGSSNTLTEYVNPLNFKAMVEAVFKYGWL